MSEFWRVVAEASIFWTVAGVASGAAAVRIPDTWLDRDSWLTRIRSGEDGGRLYQRTLRVHRWKDRLPEGGATFASGRSKRSLPAGDRAAALERFAIETRRAEWVHWFQIALSPTFAWWQPMSVSVAMVLAITTMHAPFILVQRYNRGRVLRILERSRPIGRRARTAPEPASSTPAIGRGDDRGAPHAL